MKNGFQFIILLIITVTIIGLITGGYQVLVLNKTVSFDNILDIVNPRRIKLDPLKKVKPQTDQTTGPLNENLMCMFSEGDTVHSWDGNIIDHESEVKCSECNQYIYRADDGCYLYGYDKIMNENTCVNNPDDSFCKNMKDMCKDQDPSKCILPKGVCTVGNINTNYKSIQPKKCPF